MLSSNELSSKAYNLHNLALLLLLDSISRFNQNLLVQLKDYNWAMLNVTKTLSATFTLKDLHDVIVKLLPTLNISYCFIALYENFKNNINIPTRKAKVFLNFLS